MSRQAAQATADRCPDGKRTPVQQFDAVGNEGNASMGQTTRVKRKLVALSSTKKKESAAIGT